MSQCWPSPVSPYGITKGHNRLIASKARSHDILTSLSGNILLQVAEALPPLDEKIYASPAVFRVSKMQNKQASFIPFFIQASFIPFFICPFEKRTYYAVAMSVRLSIRPSVRVFRTFLHHALRYQFETWYTFSRWHDMSSLSCITIGSLWPSLLPKVGQTHFLQSWPHKSR